MSRLDSVLPTPLVSVIMIFLNAETFIREAIESVVAQTYPAWELLLVDDGSSDASTGIALDYATRYPGRIRYFQHAGHRNLGMSASRNLGIREARGCYIALLDADDVYRPEKLERQVATLERVPSAAMVYGATEHWHSWTGRAEDQCRDQLRTLGVVVDTLIQPPEMIPKFLRLEAQTPGTCGVLARRDAVERIGGFDASFRGMYEDQVFLYKMCLAFPVYVSGDSLDRYRQQPFSHTAKMRASGYWDPRGRPNAAYSTFLSWLKGYLLANQIRDPVVWQALQEQLWPYQHPIRYRFVRTLTVPSWGMPALRWVTSGRR